MPRFRPALRPLAPTARIGALCALTALPTGAQTPPSYGLTFLGEASAVSALSTGGQVIGQRLVAGNSRALVLRAGQAPLLLPLPAGQVSSSAFDQNELGQVVGAVSAFSSTEFAPRAARWDPDGQGGFNCTLLGQLPGHSGGAALAINDLGDVVGYSTLGSFRTPVWFNAPGGIFDLTPLQLFDPRAINSERVLCDATGRRADLDDLSVELLPLPAGPPSYIAAAGGDINSGGAVAGRLVLATSSGCVYRAARYLDGAGWQLLSPCGPVAGAFEINLRGDVLYTAFTVLTPLLHLEGLGDFGLSALLAPSTAGWEFSTGLGLAIDDSRRIATWARNPATGQQGAVLLTPTWTEQPSVGPGGPSHAVLSVSGAPLASGASADLLLTGATPAGPVWLIVGAAQIGLPLFAGLLGPLPETPVGPLALDASGSLSLPALAGGQGPLSLFVQALFPAPALPQGVGFSNTLRLDFLP